MPPRSSGCIALRTGDKLRGSLNAGEVRLVNHEEEVLSALFELGRHDTFQIASQPRWTSDVQARLTKL